MRRRDSTSLNSISASSSRCIAAAQLGRAHDCSVSAAVQPTHAAFLLLVACRRCAFGHTCKFHHPELPQGASMAPAFGVPSYHMASGYPGHPGGPGPSPMMGSLLGMHGGKPGGPGVPPHGPGLMAVGSPPGPSSPHFFLPPFPRESEERVHASGLAAGSCGSWMWRDAECGRQWLSVHALLLVRPHAG